MSGMSYAETMLPFFRNTRSYKNAHSSRKEEWALVEYAGVLLGTIQLCGRYFQAERRGVRSESQGQLAGRHREVGIRSIGAFRMFQNIF